MALSRDWASRPLPAETTLTREERYAEYAELGFSNHEIARREGIDYASLLKWLTRADEEPEM